MDFQTRARMGLLASVLILTATTPSYATDFFNGNMSGACNTGGNGGSFDPTHLGGAQLYSDQFCAAMIAALNIALVGNVGNNPFSNTNDGLPGTAGTGSLDGGNFTYAGASNYGNTPLVGAGCSGSLGCSAQNTGTAIGTDTANAIAADLSSMNTAFADAKGEMDAMLSVESAAGSDLYTDAGKTGSGSTQTGGMATAISTGMGVKYQSNIGSEVDYILNNIGSGNSDGAILGGISMEISGVN
ncbi:MAG: hypothetical protein ACXWOH_11000, partial [Bdellovibrionota bacterium]